MARKGGKGRKRIAIAKIQNKSHLQVTFSKRCYGLFKKLNELCIRCDTEAAVIVFSPGNKSVYSYGHPSVRKVFNKHCSISNDDNELNVESEPNLSVLSEITELEEKLARSKAKGKQLKELLKTKKHYLWTAANDDQATPEQIALLKVKLQELHNECQILKLKMRFEAEHDGEAGPSGTNT